METLTLEPTQLEARIGERLRDLRAQRGWSLNDLADRSGVSRATLSRLENADVSPTTTVLAKLCAAYGLTLSRLIHMVEDDAVPVVRRADQPVWHDSVLGFRRRSVSPPSRALTGEVVDVRLDPAARISYDAPPRPGLEHHLVLLEGGLQVAVDGTAHDLQPGDCLRYQLYGASRFAASDELGARYMLFVV